MTDTAYRHSAFLEKAGLVVLAVEVAILGALIATTGFDRASQGYPILVVATAMFVAGQRRLAVWPPNRGAAQWIFASRAAALTMLALGALAIGFYRLVPDTAPAPGFVPRGLFAVMWLILALKGAAMGKLKPGSAMGFCVSWTRHSRLAWERAHRVLGRVLFWCGLLGLAINLVVTPLVSIAMWAGTVVLAVTAALIESRRAWHRDPERSGDGHATS